METLLAMLRDKADDRIYMEAVVELLLSDDLLSILETALKDKGNPLWARYELLDRIVGQWHDENYADEVESEETE